MDAAHGTTHTYTIIRNRFGGGFGGGVREVTVDGIC